MCNCNCNKSEESRFVYYIDVGNLPKDRAEQVVKEAMEKFRAQLPEHEKNRWLYVPTRENSRIERL